MTTSPLWDQCNNSELYQICRTAGLPVLPTFPKERMIELLEGLEEAQDVEHVVDGWRDALKSFIDDFRPKLQSQLTCPAKDPNDPKPCYRCVDTQVYACLVTNSTCEQYIQLRRKTR